MYTTNRKDIQWLLNRNPAVRTALEVSIYDKGLYSLWDYSFNPWFWTLRLILLGRMISLLFRSQFRPLDLDHSLLPDSIRLSTARVVGR